jgi:hypothetical protein
MDSHRKTYFLTFAAASPSAKGWRYLDVNYRPSSSLSVMLPKAGFFGRYLQSQIILIS